MHGSPGRSRAKFPKAAIGSKGVVQVTSRERVFDSSPASFRLDYLRVAAMLRRMSHGSGETVSVYYEIRAIEETKYKHSPSSLCEVSAEKAACSALPIVAVITPEEFENLGIDLNVLKKSPMALIHSESNYVDVYPDFIVGSLSIPRKSCGSPLAASFAFYLDKTKLLFVDDDTGAESILSNAVSTGVLGDVTPAHCLYFFMKEFLINEYSELNDFEDSMEDYEENLLRRKADIQPEKLVEFRRCTMRFGIHYQQITAIATELADNENKMMSKADARSFDHIAALAERLTSRSEVLKEYSMQLHEMQETHISMKQNAIMQVFTIVTVLFAPLTLVTGWFGMNLKLLPGIDWGFMWIALIAVGVTSTTLLLLLFHRKKWL